MIYFPLRDYVHHFPDRQGRDLASFSKWFCRAWEHTNVLAAQKGMGSIYGYQEDNTNKVAQITMGIEKLLRVFPFEDYLDDSTIRILADLEINDIGEEYQLHYLCETIETKDQRIWIFDTRDPKVQEILYRFRQRFNRLREFYTLAQCPMTCYFFSGRSDLPLADGQSWAVVDLRGQVCFDDPSDSSHLMPSRIRPREAA